MSNDSIVRNFQRHPRQNVVVRDFTIAGETPGQPRVRGRCTDAFPLLAVQCLLVSLMSMVLIACTDNGEIGDYRYRTDMYEQPSFKRHEDPRPPVKNTVPVGGVEMPIRDSAAAARLVNPVKHSSLNADSAKFLYEAYCTPCHGLGAKGDGLVAAKFQIPPDLTDQKYRRASDGYLYFVIRNGHLIMPSYAEALKSRERWLVVNHLRTLQK
jgi:mono/diheme cytochrome c family protein